jgi:hypothetical protein
MEVSISDSGSRVRNRVRENSFGARVVFTMGINIISDIYEVLE